MKTVKNRNKSLKNIQNTKWFRIEKTRKKIPGQLIRLYASTLRNNFPGQQLKEFDPKEYLKQKQKLKVHQNKSTQKYNRKSPPKTIETKSDFLIWLERMEKE